MLLIHFLLADLYAVHCDYYYYQLPAKIIPSPECSFKYPITLTKTCLDKRLPCRGDHLNSSTGSLPFLLTTLYLPLILFSTSFHSRINPITPRPTPSLLTTCYRPVRIQPRRSNHIPNQHTTDLTIPQFPTIITHVRLAP